MKAIIRFAVVCGAAVLTGMPAGAAPTDIRTSNDLKQIGLAYHMHLDANSGPPSKAEDLAPFFDNNARLLKMLKDETVVFFYKVGLNQMPSGSSNTILAYDKDVPQKGGLVLMADASVKKLSAEDFKKTPKAGKVKDKDM
jgi:hypothetical protein